MIPREGLILFANSHAVDVSVLVGLILVIIPIVQINPGFSWG